MTLEVTDRIDTLVVLQVDLIQAILEIGNDIAAGAVLEDEEIADVADRELVASQPVIALATGDPVGTDVAKDLLLPLLP